MASFQLRDYQSEAVSATIKHFQKSNESAVIVLPTGSGKSLVIAELARLAKRKILVLTHVKELVEQNHQKYESYGLTASIYSAGLKKKKNDQQVTFASIQSVARNLADFSQYYSLIIVDECHRVNIKKENGEGNNQYQQVIELLTQTNPEIKLLGLTATPYRLGMGWIYRKHHRGIMRSEQARPFEHCIYELPLRYLIKRQYLTQPTLVDATIEHYDFSALRVNNTGEYNPADINHLLNRNPRITQGIIEQVVDLALQRQGVMIFAATVEHAQEVQSYLPTSETALIIGDTDNKERGYLIQQFKQKRIKYLVNVSVLTTGFDAPHVDMIAILRPTQSVSLYQQIIGRGLRLSEGKKDCLIIDYTGNDFDLYQPEVGEKKPNSQAKPMQVLCPSCEFPNIFWGISDDDGHLIEHYGRRCQGLINDVQCDYRFVFKECPQCGEENDIAARKCSHCFAIIVDPDDMLKKALQLKDAKVIRCAGTSLAEKEGKLKITYHDEAGTELSETFDLSQPRQVRIFNELFSKRLKVNLSATQTIEINSVSQALAISDYFPSPDFVIARKQKYYWRVKDRIFDYKGRYRKANQL
ncbi:MAG: DEAD/DEAH box helicase family protein [Oleispira sp.]|nr:DEAD/DEAH box helicase family protein [Oleispira sp.]